MTDDMKKIIELCDIPWIQEKERIHDDKGVYIRKNGIYARRGNNDFEPYIIDTGEIVFNRTVTLRDIWARLKKKS